uniref:Putative LAGLIDADG homing endonuclease n=1 Tax=Monomastix sp. (strain OKE-1) TaxID=141716 RepID=Q9B7G6_MONSK|nr:putative LAGLIDADG homing endonuclease [Monomastix sp. OKE-1]AAG61149.1 putative site-specific DNA endonuclease [Monomastix sp. OKE-1]AGZ90173.1 putative LAGLIDADG homing endonuclease [Monomastix sp. OKE-1]
MKLTSDWICGFVEGEGCFCISISKIRSVQSKTPENLPGGQPTLLTEMTSKNQKSSFPEQSLEKKESVSKQVRLVFKVTQGVKNIQVLYALKKFFGVGHVKSQQASGKVWEYTVSRFEHLHTKIIPFFEKNTLYTSKQFDFYRFRKVALYMSRKEHLTFEGLAKIEKLTARMNTPECLEEVYEESFDEDKVRTFSKEKEEDTD